MVQARLSWAAGSYPHRLTSFYQWQSEILYEEPSSCLSRRPTHLRWTRRVHPGQSSTSAGATIRWPAMKRAPTNFVFRQAPHPSACRPRRSAARVLARDPAGPGHGKRLRRSRRNRPLSWAKLHHAWVREARPAIGPLDHHGPIHDRHPHSPGCGKGTLPTHSPIPPTSLPTPGSRSKTKTEHGNKLLLQRRPTDSALVPVFARDGEPRFPGTGTKFSEPVGIRRGSEYAGFLSGTP